MGRLEKQIIAGALALVGILLSVVVYRGVERGDPTLTIPNTSEWHDPAESSPKAAKVLEDPVATEVFIEDPVVATVENPTPQVEEESVSDSSMESGVAEASFTPEEPVIEEAPTAELITLDDADSWDTGLREYVVQPGDVLSRIALNQLGSSKLVHEILMLNEGLNPNTLQVNQVIVLPSKRAGQLSVNEPKVVEASPSAARTHTIVAGDTLTSIVNRYRINGGVPAIVKANDRLTDEGTMLQLGWQLVIPE